MSDQRFTASYAGTLDTKGRVCIPAAWRQVLAAQNTAGVYLCPSLEGQSLLGFGQEMMDSELKRLEDLDPILSGLHDDLAAPLVSGSTHLPIDENGRVRIPDELIATAGLKDRVAFVGVARKFEIWNPETFAAVKAARMANALAERKAMAAQEAAARAHKHGAAEPTVPAGEGQTP